MSTPRRIGDYDVVKRTGNGSCKARSRHTDQDVTIRRIFDAESMMHSNEGVSLAAIREISLLKQLNKNKHIIRLLDTFMTIDHEMYLVLEFCPLTLQEYVARQHDKLSMAEMKSYLHQMLQAMSYSHALRIVHCDLHPRNVYLATNGPTLQIKISGFGHAHSENEQGADHRANSHDSNTQNFLYRAPEVLLGARQHSTKVDIWSIACVFVTMLNGNRCLFEGCEHEIVQLMQIFKVFGTPNYDGNDQEWTNIGQQCQYYNRSFPKWKAKDLKTQVIRRKDLNEDGYDLLQKMFTLNPKRRLSAKQCLRHQFFATVIEFNFP